MKQHEREYFISRIRSGLYQISHKGEMIIIRTPNIAEQYLIERSVFEEYEKCRNEGVPTTEDLLEEMDNVVQHKSGDYILLDGLPLPEEEEEEED